MTQRYNPKKNFKYSPALKDKTYIVEDEEEEDTEYPGPVEILGKEKDDEELEQMLAELMEEAGNE